MIKSQPKINKKPKETTFKKTGKIWSSLQRKSTGKTLPSLFIKNYEKIFIMGTSDQTNSAEN